MYRILTVVVTLALLVGCEARLTRANYDQIKAGMTLAEVEQILGPGELDTTQGMNISSEGLTGGSKRDSRKTYRWKESGSGEITVLLDKDGKVVDMNQIGL